MIAEILGTLFTIMGLIIVLILTIVMYYLSYKVYKQYREDYFLKGEGSILFCAISLTIIATMFGLMLSWGIAKYMGW